MMKKNSKSFVLVMIASFFILLFMNNNVFSQTCPFAKADLDSTYSGVPVMVWIGQNDSVGASTPAPSLTITTGPSHGSVTIINGDSIVYTPNVGYVGNDFFFYTVCDTPSGCGCASSQVVILVRRPPCIAVNSIDDNSIIGLNTSSFLNFLQNDTTALGQGFTSSTILSGPFHGTSSLVGLDSLTYTPDSFYVGMDTILYRACNSCGKCDTAYVYYTVLSPCAAPTATNDSLTQESGLTSTLDLTTNDISDSTITSISIIINPLHAIASLSGSVLTYVSDSTYSGTDMLMYEICSTCGCDTAIVYINVLERCIPPSSLDDIGATGYSSLCNRIFNVSVNDIGNYLTTTIISGPNHGTASVVGNSISYASDSTLFGAYDTIVYVNTNTCGTDTASLYVFVNSTYPCNGFAPQILNDTINSCRNDDSIVVNVRTNDFDADGNIITITSLIAPSNGFARILNDSQIIYISNPGFFGVDLFSYTACDNGLPSLCNSAFVYVNVGECRNPPHITDPTGADIDTMIVNLPEDTDSTLCVPLYDIDGDNVTTSIVGIWENGVFTNLTDTCILIHPNTNQYGSDTVLLIACDDRDTLCDTVVLIINVYPVNDPPVGNVDIAIYTESTIIVSPLNNDTDPDMGDTLSISFAIGLNPNAGTTVLNPDGTVSFTADSAFAGIDTIAYIVCDNNGLCDTTAILVFVGPKANEDYATTPLNTATTINLLANDVYSGNSIISLCSNPTNGSVTINNGTVTYTPNNGYSGNDEFCYTLCDTATGLCDTSLVHIIIQNKTLFIPQGFSPNGDGINDFWNIEGIDNFPNAEVTVFSRWGDEVWTNGVTGYKNNTTDGFIGNNRQNGALPDGTYYYLVKFNVDGIKNQAGFLQINR